MLAMHRRKNVHFLAWLFTEIDFTLSGMLDKQHLGLQLSAHNEKQGHNL